MKFHIDKHILKKPLEQVSKALPSRSVIPILNSILFEVNDSGLSLIAGDTDTTIKATISTDDFELIAPGSILLPGKKIVDIVQKAPDDISFDTNELQVKIKSGKSKFELTGLSSEEYPKFIYGSGSGMVIKGEIFRTVIKKTLFATSDKEETPILTGLNFRFGNGVVDIAGTDRHRLAATSIEIENENEHSAVIKNLSLSELLKLIDLKEDMNFFFQGNKLVVNTSGFTFVTTLLEGSFPDVYKIIPTSFSNIATVNTSQLKAAIDRVFIVAREERTNLISITVGEEVLIESKASSGFHASETVDLIDKIGENFKFSANGKYVQEALEAIDSVNVGINFNSAMSPIILTGNDDVRTTQLVLPYRTV